MQSLYQAERSPIEKADLKFHIKALVWENAFLRINLFPMKKR